MRKQICSSILVCFAAGLLISMPEAAKTGMRNGMELIGNVILPGLFPFFLLSEFWIRSGGAMLFDRTARPLMNKLFHLPGACAQAFILGSIGGYPVGAKTIAQLHTNGSLSKEDAEQALLFCCNAGPAFLISVIGGMLFRQISMGVFLFIIHVVSAIIIGILFRPNKLPTSKPDIISPSNNASLSTALTQSIAAAGQTVLHVSIVILLFSVLMEYANRLVSFLAIPELSILTGVLEITNGIAVLEQLGLPRQITFAAAAFLVGFGGISIMLQSLSLLEPCGLSCRKLWIGKILQGLLSAAMGYWGYPFMGASMECFSAVPQTTGVLLCQEALLVVTAMFAKITSGKPAKNRI